MKKISLFAMLLIVVFGIGQLFAQEEAPFPPPTQPLVACDDAATPCDVIATTAKDITGVWAVYFNAELAYIRYNDDGTWWLTDSLENSSTLSSDYPNGTFTFDENNVFTSTDPFPELPDECRSGSYVIRVIKVGGQPIALNKAVLDDCFAPRRTDWAYTLLWAGE